MRRLAASLVLATALGTWVAVAGLGASSAGATAPDQQGWWTTVNQGPVPEVGQPAPAPTPPDVPAKGLLVEGSSSSASSSPAPSSPVPSSPVPSSPVPSPPASSSPVPSSPVAYAGLVYYLPLGATASTLTLTIAANSATTPNTTLQLCPLVNPVLIPEQGGPSSDAPPYDCTQSVSAAPNAAGSAYKFQVSELVTEGSLAVAILPTSPTDRVVLSQPDANSLTVQPGAASSLPQIQSPSPGGTSISALGIPLPEPMPTFGTSLFGITPSPAPAAASAAPAPPASSAPAQASPRSYSAIPVLGVFSENASPLTAALVLAGLSGGAALWFYAGRRRPDEGEVAVADGT